MKYWLDSRINTTGLFFNHHHPLMVAWTVKVWYCFWIVFIAFRRPWHDYYQLERLFSALFKVASPKGCFCQIRRFSVQSRNYTTGCFYASITALAVILCLDTKAFYLLFHSKSSNWQFDFFRNGCSKPYSSEYYCKSEFLNFPSMLLISSPTSFWNVVDWLVAQNLSKFSSYSKLALSKLSVSK